MTCELASRNSISGNESTGTQSAFGSIKRKDPEAILSTPAVKPHNAGYDDLHAGELSVFEVYPCIRDHILGTLLYIQLC